MSNTAAQKLPGRRKIRDDVVDRLKELITSERLVPGDRLPTESELATRFGVSRLSVREATKALEFLGIVESKTGVGLSVRGMDLARMTGHLGFHPALQLAEPLELIHTRLILETGAVPHVAERMSVDPGIAAELRQILSRSRTAQKLTEWIEIDIAFHHALLNASGLRPLVAFGELLHVFFQRFRENFSAAEWRRGSKSHDRIVDLLEAGDVNGATHELRRHIESHKALSGVTG